MLKLRHLCLKELQDCPQELKDDLSWEVENEINKLETRIIHLEDSIEHLRFQRLKCHSTVCKVLTKKIIKLEDEIAQFLFDDWIPVEEKEEIWREYFFCLYDFMVSDKNHIDLSNVRLLSEDSVKIYDTLKRPRLHQSSDVRLLDYKFLELYTVYKKIDVPDISQKANETLEKNIEITKMMSNQRDEIRISRKTISTYEELLSSSLCSRK